MKFQKPNLIFFERTTLMQYAPSTIKVNKKSNKVACTQGRIQEFLIGGSNLQRGFRFVKYTHYLLIFPEFFENEIILKMK